MNKETYEKFAEFFKNSQVKESRELFKKVSKLEGKEALEKIIAEDPCYEALNFYVLVTEESCPIDQFDAMNWYRKNKGFQKADLLQKFAEAARRRKANNRPKNRRSLSTLQIPWQDAPNHSNNKIFS